jgi:hypothetical protein
VAGGAVALVRPWGGELGPIETAKRLQKRLRTSDQYDCREPSGIPVPGEPSWDWVCNDLTRAEGQAYLVKTNGDRITAIQPVG